MANENKFYNEKSRPPLSPFFSSSPLNPPPPSPLAKPQNKERIEENKNDIYLKKQQERNEIYNQKREMEINFLKNTLYYIENYLTPNRPMYKRYRKEERIEQVRQIRYMNVDWITISNHIRDMNYRDFLATPYWKIIAAHTKYMAGYRCRHCKRRWNLVTHHSNYEIHGREHAHMNELIVLCNQCHENVHGIEETDLSLDGSSGGSYTLLAALIFAIVACFLIWRSL